MEKTYVILVFRILKFRQQKTRTLKALWLPQHVALREFPGHSTGRGNSGRAYAAGVHRMEYQRGDSYTQREHQRSEGGSLQVFSRVLISVSKWRNYQRPWTIWKNKSELYLMLTENWKQYLSPLSRLEKLIIHRAMGTVLRIVLPQQRRIIARLT